MKKKILSLIIAVSFVLMSLPVAYAADASEENSLDFISENNTDDTALLTVLDETQGTYTVGTPFEKGTFTLKDVKKIRFGWQNANLVMAAPAAVGGYQTFIFRDNNNATYGGMPCDAVTLTFTIGFCA